MSFSQQVKNELGRHTSGSPDELVTALAVMLLNMSCFELSEEGEYRLHLSRGSSAALTKCFTLLKKTANISYELASGEDVRELAALIDILDEKGCIRDTDGAVSWSLLSNERCVRSYLRNLFLCIGSVSDPARNYHLEFVCAKEGQAAQLMRVLEEENYHPQMNFRRGKQVVSVRDAQQVADLLTLMGAHASLLDLENARVIRQVRGQVNRRVNCETSNIQRSVDAARRQLEDIELVMASSIFETLPESIQQTAKFRVANADASMKELGEMFHPPVGKSGIHHRLHKLTELADSLRKQDASPQASSEKTL